LVALALAIVSLEGRLRDAEFSERLCSAAGSGRVTIGREAFDAYRRVLKDEKQRAEEP